MSFKYTLNIIITFGVIVFGIIIYFYLQLLRKKSAEDAKNKIIGKKKKAKFSKLFRLYRTCNTLPIIKKNVRKLVNMYTSRMPADYKGARECAMRDCLFLWTGSLVVVSLALILGASPYVISCVVLFVYVFNDFFVMFRSESLDMKLLTQLDFFLDEMRFYFFETGDIAESLKEAGDKTSYDLIKQHAVKLHAVVTSENIIEAAKKYNHTTSDIYLKRFLAVCAPVAQYGDRTVDDESLFLKSLRSIKTDITMEKLRRRQIANAFNANIVISAIPYFFLGLLYRYCKATFESVADLVSGTYGAVGMAVCFVVTIVTYQILMRLKAPATVDTDEPKMWKKIYKFKPMKKVVDSIMVRNWGATLRLEKELKKVGSNLGPSLFWTKRVFYAFCAFIIALCFMIGVHSNARKIYHTHLTGVTTTSHASATDSEFYQMYVATKVYVDKYYNQNMRKIYNSNMGGGSMTWDAEVAEYITSLVVDDLNLGTIDITEEQGYEYLQEFLENYKDSSAAFAKLYGIPYENAINSNDGIIRNAMNFYRKLLKTFKQVDIFDDETNFDKIVSEYVAKRVCKAKNSHFTWYDILIAFLFCVGVYNFPVILMKISKQQLQLGMQDEVIQFESVILILMYMERMTVEQILTWLVMFSDIFKVSLQRCECYFPIEGSDAVDRLAKDEPFEPFKRLILNLKAVDRVGVTVAFNGLLAERTNYQEERKIDNQITLEKNTRRAQTLVMIPAYAVVIAGMLGPFIIAAITEIFAAFQQMAEVSEG